MFDDAAFRKEIPYPLVPMMRGVYAYPPPLDNFDPSKAGPEQLIQNGILWPRPSSGDDPSLLDVKEREDQGVIRRLRGTGMGTRGWPTRLL